MVTSLRKGSTTIQLNHIYGTDSIRAVNTEAELDGRTVIFRTTIKPVDGNQREDADRHINDESDTLKSISFHDSYIRERFDDFLRFHIDDFDQLVLELNYSKLFRLPVKASRDVEEGYLFTLA